MSRKGLSFVMQRNNLQGGRESDSMVAGKRIFQKGPQDAQNKLHLLPTKTTLTDQSIFVK